MSMLFAIAPTSNGATYNSGIGGPQQLAVPGSFEAGTPGSTSCPFSWTDTNGAPNESSFQIQIATDNAFTSIVQTLNPSANATSATATGLNPTTTYHARMKAVGDGTTTTDSDWSSPISFTTAVHSFIQLILDGTLSGNLFDIAGGVNEFDLITPVDSPDGNYHLFYTRRDGSDNCTTMHRQATTISGLSSALATAITTDIRYPTAIYVGGNYHLWGRDLLGATTGDTRHYKATTIGGLSAGLVNHFDNGTDSHVRPVPGSPGSYLMGAKEGSLSWMLFYTSNDIDGVGFNSSSIVALQPTGGTFYADQITDTAPFYLDDGTLWALFGAVAGSVQSLGIVQLNPSTKLPIGDPVQIRTPSLSWEGSKIFNPVYIDDGATERVYYAANAGSEGTPAANAGWGYIQLASAP